MLPFSTNVQYKNNASRDWIYFFFTHVFCILLYFQTSQVTHYECVTKCSVHIEFTRMIACNKKCEQLPGTVINEETTANVWNIKEGFGKGESL